MKVLSVIQIKDCDNYTIENEPIASIDLMERAAIQIFDFVVHHYNQEDSFILFAGSGNNGGDALALARLLYKTGYKKVKVYLLGIGKLSADCNENLKRLQELKEVLIAPINKGDDFPDIDECDIVIDGIFGSGLNRPVSGYWGELVNYINDNATEIVAIDIPSGLFGENNLENAGAIINATITLSFQFPKLAFFFAENYNYVGEWFMLDIGLHSDFVNEIETPWNYLMPQDILQKLQSRKKFAHKGNFGHAFLIAGSFQKTGAAVLASQACLRSGVGLLTVHVPESGYNIMQTAVPEAMLCIDETEFNFCESSRLDTFSALGIGPGIGMKKSIQNAFCKILEGQKRPIVIDADALNILANNKEWLLKVPKHSVLTPHPREFDRLTKNHNSSYERMVSQIKLSEKYDVIVVLKGAHTTISLPNGELYFNSTGNPGMATAGSGDVLTGIILSLLAQGYLPEFSALIGVYIHGLSGDIALEELSHEALIASDIIHNLGSAFLRLKQ